MLDKSHPAPPDWIHRNAVEKEGAHFVTGKSIGSKVESEDAAIENALANFVGSLETVIQKRVKLVQEQSDTGASSSHIRRSIEAQSRKLAVRDFKVIDSYWEQRRSENETQYHTWVLLQIPNSERLRLTRKLMGLATLSIRCDPAAMCSDGIRSRMLSLASKNLAKNHAITIIDKNASHSGASQEKTAAYRLNITIRETNDIIEDEIHYVWTDLDWKLVSTEDGGTLESLSVPSYSNAKGIKGGGFTREAAVQLSLETLFDELDYQLAKRK